MGIRQALSTYAAKEYELNVKRNKITGTIAIILGVAISIGSIYFLVKGEFKTGGKLFVIGIVVIAYGGIAIKYAHVPWLSFGGRKRGFTIKGPSR